MRRDYNRFLDKAESGENKTIWRNYNCRLPTYFRYRLPSFLTNYRNPKPCFCRFFREEELMSHYVHIHQVPEDIAQDLISGDVNPRDVVKSVQPKEVIVTAGGLKEFLKI